MKTEISNSKGESASSRDRTAEIAARFDRSSESEANIAEAAGASAVLIINNPKELYKMVCELDETDLNIHILAVILPQDAGTSLEKMLMYSSLGNFPYYP
ncbi:hypothetical protein CsSME_00021716 [Camellia sinensis var. sinensis]